MRSFLKKIGILLGRLRSGAIAPSNVRFARIAVEIDSREGEFAALADEQLRSRWADFRERVVPRAALDQVLVSAFAIVREVAKRSIGLRPYDVQVLAAVALHQGNVVEMQTGEGKTLAATLTACLWSLTRKNVHVLTFNDYLAERDAKWMGPIYRFLGLTVASVGRGTPPAERRSAYASDVVYVTAKEAGFDFLRDELCMDFDQLLRRSLHYAIIDEADSILIDEARIPLVIAGPEDEGAQDLGQLAEVVRGLAPDDYSIDQELRNVSLTSKGLDRLERHFGQGLLHSEENLALLTRVNLALQADTLLKRDVDYIVRAGEILLVDEFTGRIAENRRWPYGLQEALEAKEGLHVQPQGRILNSITMQHFVGQFERVCGMTGTAQEAAEELDDFYGLKTVVVPPNRPSIRIDRPDCIFVTKAGKYAALVREVAELHAEGRPVLIGTATILESQRVASLLSEAGIPFQILNAKNDHEEAAIVAESGAAGAMTISTNMSGRGTDIRLGGRDERNHGLVSELGGLFVIGTNRHESRRIDNQLRGRAGRQAEPGETRFFVSLEDDLLVRHGIAATIACMDDADKDGVVTNPGVSRKIAHIQRVIEGESFEIRRTLRKYTFPLESQRRHIRERRRKILTGEEPIDGLLQRRNQPLFDRLGTQLGPEGLADLKRRIVLRAIDLAWSDHLEAVAEIRDNIHLISMGGFSAFDEFNHRANQSFQNLPRKMDDYILDIVQQIEASSSASNTLPLSLLGPSSTWTYMINDNPTGDVTMRLSRAIRRAIRR